LAPSGSSTPVGTSAANTPVLPLTRERRSGSKDGPVLRTDHKAGGGERESSPLLEAQRSTENQNSDSDTDGRGRARRPLRGSGSDVGIANAGAGSSSSALTVAGGSLVSLSSSGSLPPLSGSGPLRARTPSTLAPLNAGGRSRARYGTSSQQSDDDGDGEADRLLH
jgi:hypothetical protein